MSVRPVRSSAACACLLAVAACASPGRDTGPDSHALSDMKASVWVDPDGCRHWVIDDGVEGYMSPALKPDGTPDCG